MSKVLAATCTAGIVQIEGLPLPGAVVLSEGVAASEGVAVLDEDSAFYLTKTSPDLKTTLEHLVSVLTQVKTALDQTVTVFTSIGAGMTGGSTAPPPTLATDTAVITAAATAINTLKTTLNTLKGALK